MLPLKRPDIAGEMTGLSEIEQTFWGVQLSNANSMGCVCVRTHAHMSAQAHARTYPSSDVHVKVNKAVFLDLHNVSAES